MSLDNILKHPAFRSSPQLSAFLYYVVNEEIAGRGEAIKAYTVAVDALGRPDSFDPSSDPVIRVVANRLRKALDRVYQDENDAIPIRIRLVQGSYRPIFTLNGQTDTAKPEKSSEPTSPPRALYTSTTLRYHLIIGFLLVLLMIAIAYIIWHTASHTHAMAPPVDTMVPREEHLTRAEVNQMAMPIAIRFEETVIL